MQYSDFIRTRMNSLNSIAEATGYPCVLTKSKGKALKDYKLYGNSFQSTLPFPYQSVEYIESSRTQRITLNSSLTINSYNTKAKWTSQNLKDYAGNTKVFEFGSVASKANFSGWEEYHSYYLSTLGTEVEIYSANTQEKHTVEMARTSSTTAYLKENDVIIGTATGTFAVATDVLTLFGSRTGVAGYMGRLYSFEFWQDDIKLYDLIPCYNVETNEIGMYNTIDGLFYKNNSGTEDFIKGNDITPTPENPIEVISLGESSRNLADVNVIEYPIRQTPRLLNTKNIDISKLPLTFSMKSTNQIISRFYIECYDINNTYIGAVTKYLSGTGDVTRTYTITIGLLLSGTQSIKLYDCPTSSSSFPVLDYDIQIEQGTTATEYRQYKYIDIVSSGKNLFNKETITTSAYIDNTGTIISPNAAIDVSDYIKVKPSTQYTMNPCSWNIDGISKYINCYNDSKELIGVVAVPSSKGYFTTLDNTAYIKSSIPKNVLNVFQIEEGNLATSYETYQTPIKTTINLEGHEPLRKIGNVADYIDYKNRKIIRNIWKLELTGNEDSWEEVSSGTPNNLYRLTVSNSSIINYYDGEIITHFKFGVVPVSSTTINVSDVYYSTTLCKTYFRCRPDLTLYPTLADFKAFLQEQYANGTPVTVYGVLQTPVEESFGYYEPLRQVGDISDYIDYENKKIVRNVAELVLNGTEDFYSNQPFVGYQAISILKTDVGTNSTILPRGSNRLSCSHFTTSTTLDRMNIGEIYSGVSYINFNYDNVNNLTTFKNWLAQQYANGTPVKVWYPLATPTEEPFNNITIPTTKNTCIITSNDEEIEASNIYAKYYKK